MIDTINWPANIRRPLPWEKEDHPNPPVAEHGKNGDADLDNRVSAYLAAIPGAVSGQGGHGQTFKVACYLVNGWALSATEALPYLQNYNQRCEPPWSDKELIHKLADAEKVQHKEPRGHLRGPEGDTDGKQPARLPTVTEVARKLEILYDSNRTSFWVKNDRNAWMLVTAGDIVEVGNRRKELSEEKS